MIWGYPYFRKPPNGNNHWSVWLLKGSRDYFLLTSREYVINEFITRLMLSGIYVEVSWLANTMLNRLFIEHNEPCLPIRKLLVPRYLRSSTLKSYLKKNDDLLYSTPWRIHGAGIYANINGIYWWDPWHTIYSSTMDPSWVPYRQGTSTELIRFCHVDAKPFCILSIQGSLSHACRKVE